MKKNLLVTLADEKYTEQAKQLFSSAYWNGGWSGDYLLLAHKIPEEKLKWFRDKGILVKKCKVVGELFKFKSAKLCKYYLFTPYFKKWKNVVFLDADIIVFSSIRGLADVKGFCSVRDRSPKLKNQFRKKNGDKKAFGDLKGDYNIYEKAFNSGVLAFNTNVIDEDAFRKMTNLSGRFLKISHLKDQAILNLFFYKKWKELPIAYNFNPFLIKHPFLTKKNPNIRGIILHFPGSRKPWNERYSYYYKIWKENLDRAEFIEIRKLISPTTKYSKDEIKKISKNIKRKLFIHSSVNYLDKIVGQAGIFLKRKTPNVYNKLKNFQTSLLEAR